MRLALTLSAALALTLAAQAALACAPPPPPWLLGKTLPVADATAVPVNSAILLFPQEGLDQEAIDQRIGAACVVQPADEPERIPQWEDRGTELWRDGFRFQPPALLDPDTDYAVICGIWGFDSDEYHRWRFRTAPAAATLPLSSRFMGATPFNAVRKETRCEWVGGGCSSAPDCRSVEALHEHGEVEARLAVDAGDWPEVMVFVGAAGTPEAAMARARSAGHATVVPSGELDLAADAGRAHENTTGELCTAVIVESMAGERQAIDAHCVDAPEPTTAPVAEEPAPSEPGHPIGADAVDQIPGEAESAGGCSASPGPGGAPAGLALLLLGVALRRRRR